MSDSEYNPVCDKCHERKPCHSIYSHVYCESCWPDPWGLRTRAEQAEAAHARHAADRSREVTELHRAHERALRRAEKAEAEVARLRGELDRLRVTTADIETMRQMTEDVRAIGARSEALAREAALREAAGVCERIYADHCGDADECHEAILSLLDAAPAAEVSDG